MSNYAYISCDWPERDSEPTISLRRFLQAAGYTIECAPPSDWNFYRCIEDAIERCDIFVVVIGQGYDGSTWLAHELHYAHMLKHYRMGAKRPRLYAISRDGYQLPVCSRHIAEHMRWIQSEQDYSSLLIDCRPESME